VVNLRRCSVFFPEQRQFFLDTATLFDLGTSFRGAGATPVVARLIAPGLRLAWNPRVQLTAFYQYNEAARQGTSNARFAWEFRPLSHLYVVQRAMAGKPSSQISWSDVGGASATGVRTTAIRRVQPRIRAGNSQCVSNPSSEGAAAMSRWGSTSTATGALREMTGQRRRFAPSAARAKPRRQR
jgi:hypothetical protein